MLSYVFRHGTQRVVVDRRDQILRAEVSNDHSVGDAIPPVEKSDEEPVEDGYRPGSIRVLERGYTWSPTVHSTIAGAGLHSSFTPLFVLAAKAKFFADRLYARLEQIAHRGAGDYPGLWSTLEAVREQLEVGSAARGLFDAADSLVGGELPPHGPAKLRAWKWLKEFRADEKASKPLGFYAESKAMSQLFQHDRLLQTELFQEVAGPIRDALLNDEHLTAAYERHLALCSRLTGPLVGPTVMNSEEPKVRLFPPSDSAEGRLIKELFGATSVPLGFHLGRELAARIRDGRMNTVPREEDGWYAHQFHAIAALLKPEAPGLEVGPRYREELEEVFLALFALNRETHVKQLEAVAGGGCPLVVSPRISVEPLPEYYGRMARGYAFVRSHLESIIGEHVLQSASLDLEGEGYQFGPPYMESLSDHLLGMEMLFAGAEAVSREELGRPLEDSVEVRAAKAWFRRWQQESPSAPALQEDLRVVVPVFHDQERKTIRICATLGVETRKLELSFIERPKVSVYGEADRFGGDPVFSSTCVSIFSGVTLECDVREVPTREEFRALCDRHQTPEAIRAALESA